MSFIQWAREWYNFFAHDLHSKPIEVHQSLQEGGDGRTDRIVPLLSHLPTFLAEQLGRFGAPANGWVDPNKTSEITNHILFIQKVHSQLLYKRAHLSSYT